MTNESQQRVLRPAKCFFWAMLFSQATFLIMAGLLCFLLILSFWPILSPEPNTDPFVKFMSDRWAHNSIIGITVLGGVALLGYVGLVFFRYSRLKYILTKTGIVFGSGINYTEDLIAWQIINDLDLTRTVPEQLMGVGTLWVSADGGIHKPMLYLKEYKQVRESLNKIIQHNYTKARRVAKL